MNAEHYVKGRTKASLSIKVWNGPGLWLEGEDLMTEELCAFLAAHLPVEFRWPHVDPPNVDGSGSPFGS